MTLKNPYVKVGFVEFYWVWSRETMVRVDIRGSIIAQNGGVDTISGAGGTEVGVGTDPVVVHVLVGIELRSGRNVSSCLAQ